jgi:small nuclear ribonucleoprotein (snRNP)-like protein
MESGTASNRVILRFLDGNILKGTLREFTVTDDAVFLEDEHAQQQKIKLRDLKAIFFVKTLEGNREYREKKSFAGTKPRSRRIFVKFKDGESLPGFLEGETPWDKGFFLDSKKSRGFFLVPVDEDSNNNKIFIVTSAVKDVAMIGG